MVTDMEDGFQADECSDVIGSPMIMIRTPATIWRAREKEMRVRTAA